MSSGCKEKTDNKRKRGRPKGSKNKDKRIVAHIPSKKDLRTVPVNEQRTREFLAKEGAPEYVQDLVLAQGLSYARIVAAERAYALSFDRTKQVEFLSAELGIMRQKAREILDAYRKQLILESANPNREQDRAELKQKARHLYESAVEDLKQAESVRERVMLRNQMFKAISYITDLDGLKTPTESNVRVAHLHANLTNHDVKSDVQLAKEKILSSGLEAKLLANATSSINTSINTKSINTESE